MDIMRIYDRLPVFGQNLACTLEGMRIRHTRFGVRQKQALVGFLERKDWNYRQKCDYRDAQLRKMVEHCYQHVPYYHGLFDSLGIDYHDIRTLDDLSCLPVLNKTVIREHFDDFLADNADLSEMKKMHTSGTTGSCFQFYYSKDAYAAQWADKERYDRYLGIDREKWSAYFGGRPIVPRKQTKPPFYRINYAQKELLFSVYHMSQKNFPNYIRGLDSRVMEYWHGYPSSMLPIAQYMLDNNIRLSYVPKAIQLTSENVTEFELHKMEKAFGIRPLQGYAQVEQVANFWQYEDGKFRIMEDLDAVELIPTGEGNLCRIVGTTLTNYGMPFLRYDTKDLATWEETEEGRLVLSIDGRDEDYIRLANGDTIRGSVSFIFSDQLEIVESQVVQKSLDTVEFHIVKGKNYTEADEKRLYASIENCLDGQIGYTVSYVDGIPKTKNGKMKFILSEL